MKSKEKFAAYAALVWTQTSFLKVSWISSQGKQSWLRRSLQVVKETYQLKTRTCRWHRTYDGPREITLAQILTLFFTFNLTSSQLYASWRKPQDPKCLDMKNGSTIWSPTLEEKQTPVFLFGLAVLPCIAKFFRLILHCKDDPRHGKHRTSPIMAKKALILRMLSTSETFFVVVLGSCSETKHFANRWQNIYHQHFIMLSSKSSLSCCQKPFTMHSTCTG